MWCFFCLHHQPQTFDLLPVFRAGGHDIDPGGVDAAVAQDICQFGDDLLNAVKSSGKQLAQIVWKYLAGFGVVSSK